MVDFNEAESIARKEVQRVIEADAELDISEVEDVLLVNENDSVWTFSADIPKLIAQGWAPGAVIVLIDKTDGHVLTEEEQLSFHKKQEKTRRRAGFIQPK